MRNRKRLAGLAAAVGVLIAGSAAVSITTAQSATSIISVGQGTGSCPAGYVCLWEHPNYTGRGVGFYGDNANYNALAAPHDWLAGRASSLYNHGNSYDVRFFWLANYSGRSFVLCRGDAVSQLPEDAELPAGSPRTWNDEIAAHDWQYAQCASPT